MSVETILLVLVLGISTANLIVLIIQRRDALEYQKFAKSEREFMISNFVNYNNKVSRLLAGIDNSDPFERKE